MGKLLLGAGFACLVATSASAIGFHIPQLPDFELLREAGEIAAAEQASTAKTVHAKQATAAHGKRVLATSGTE